ncbi:MAG TPA: helix-turn-helix transcriptional regulator [Acidobacteriota bacterium]|nr:helix-turn-helix transcriptional regulator [Acidobacteriota bacterium]
MSKETLGEFEQLVLLGCLRLGDEAYAGGVVDEIRTRTGREVAHAAVYIALRRMEEQELVSSRMGRPTAERGGRAKRFFEVLPEGRRLLDVSRTALLSMWEGVETAP